MKLISNYLDWSTELVYLLKVQIVFYLSQAPGCRPKFYMESVLSDHITLELDVTRLWNITR